MPLDNSSANALASAIYTALGASGAVGLSQWETICQEIYSHLKTDAVVDVTSVSGVTTGPSVSGPGTGTLS